MTHLMTYLETLGQLAVAAREDTAQWQAARQGNLKNLAVRRVPSEQACVEQADAYGDGKLQPSGSVHRGNRNQTLNLPLVDSSRF